MSVSDLALTLISSFFPLALSDSLAVLDKEVLFAVLSDLNIWIENTLFFFFFFFFWSSDWRLEDASVFVLSSY